MEQNNPTAMQGAQPLALDIVRTASGYACDGRHADGQSSHHAFPASLYGVTLTPEIVTSLVEHGTHRPHGTRRSQRAQELGYRASRLHLAAETDLRILQGSCPRLRRRVVKTSKGYFCEHALGQDGQCDFHELSYLAHTRHPEQEMEDFSWAIHRSSTASAPTTSASSAATSPSNAEHTLSVMLLRRTLSRLRRQAADWP
jgi:hypothetical protein